MKKFFRRLLVLTLIAVVALGLLCWQVITHLVCAEKPQKADAIVLLGGSAEERAPWAAELYREGYAHKVLVTGSQFDREHNGSVLQRCGVPAKDILYEDQSTSTKTNAINTEEMLKQHGMQRIILVTSWYHSARSYRTFKKFLSGETIICVPTKEPERWADSDYAHAKSELIKSLGYTVLHGVPLW